MQQYPYQPQPPPPPSSGANVGLIVAIVAIVLVVGFVGIMFLFGVLGYMSARRSMSAARAAAATATATSPMSATATPATLSETYTSTNGLAVVHYPPDWAAKSIDEATLTLTRNLSDGSDEVVYVAAVDHPISNDVNELARILMRAMIKNIDAAGGVWTESSRKRGVCYRAYPGGLAVDGSFSVSGARRNVHMCFFMNGSRGYEVKTIVPPRHEADDLALMQSMLDATDLK
jgi:hypothetical protein